MARNFTEKNTAKICFEIKDMVIWFEITLIFVELFLFLSLPMGRGKSGRDLQFLFLFFQQNCFHIIEREL
jgi:hypothetical protein